VDIKKLELDRDVMKWHRANLAKRIILSILTLLAAVICAVFIKSPDTLKYPVALKVGFIAAALFIDIYFLRIHKIIFDKSWAGIVEDLGFKVVIRPGHRASPTHKQAFYMDIRLNNGKIFHYINSESVSERRSEMDELITSSSRFKTFLPYKKDDIVVHLRGQKYLAVYTKERDYPYICPFCGEIVIPSRKKCYRCGSPLMPDKP